MTLWKIYNIVRKSDNGFVIEVTYACEAYLEGSIVDRHIGLLSFTQQSDSFIPFNELTQDIVLGWVYNHVGDVNKAIIETGLLNRVEKIKQDRLEESNKVSGLPWE